MLEVEAALFALLIQLLFILLFSMQWSLAAASSRERLRQQPSTQCELLPLYHLGVLLAAPSTAHSSRQAVFCGWILQAFDLSIVQQSGHN
jgi:hypothetical protein